MSTDRRGRGNGITAEEADQVLALVAAGKSIPVAANLHGWTDRTICRWANAHPDYRARLDSALVRPEPPIRHGTPGAYQRRGCRCHACRATNWRRGAAYRERVAPAFHADPADPRHGTNTGYSTYRCRCEPCKQAGSIAKARRDRARKARAA